MVEGDETAATGEGLIVEVGTGAARLELSRPAKRNAVDTRLAADFVSAVDDLEAQEVRVAVLAATPPVFSAGADLSEVGDAVLGRTIDAAIGRIRESRMLWIAEVQGPALGIAVPMVLACPLVYLAEEAWFSLPELSAVGRAPVGVARHLGPLIGWRQAVSMAVSEERIGANRALELGWATAVVPSEILPATVAARVDKLLEADPDSVRSLVETFYDLV